MDKVCPETFTDGQPDSPLSGETRHENLFDSMKFSEDLMKILSWAADEAQRTGWNNITADHLTLAILRHSDNEACAALRSAGLDMTAMKEHIDDVLMRKDAIPFDENSEIRPDRKALNCLNMALFETSSRHGLTTTAGDLLVAISKTPDCISSRYFRSAGLECTALRKLLGQTSDSGDRLEKTPDYSEQMAAAMSAELSRILNASSDGMTNAVLPNS